MSAVVACGSGGGGGADEPPQQDLMPWSRLSGKLAVVRSQFDLFKGFTGPSEVSVVNASTRTVTTIKRFEASEGVSLSAPVWRADGQAILFETMQRGTERRRAVAIDGSDVVLSPPLDDVDNRQLTWLRNGRLAWCRGRTIWIDGAPAVAQACGDVLHGESFGWSPDGSAVAVTGHADGYTDPRTYPLLALWEVTLADRAARRFFLSPDTPSPIKVEGQTFSPDGTRVAFYLESGTGSVAPRRAIWVVDTDGASPHQISSGRWDDSPAWSPDGRQIAYHSDDGVMLMNADGTSRIALGFDGDFAWTP